MPELITFGESMVLLTPPSVGSLEDASMFLRSMGGAESNFAIGAARLGISVGWFSRLGKDPFGAYLLKKIRGEGVDTSQVTFDPIYPTAVMFKETKAVGNPNVYYYRRESACSQMKPCDLDEGYIAQAKILHITGITTALSDSCRETIYQAIEIAKRHHTKISFDPNIRLKLWSMDEAREVLLDLAARSDYFFPGEEELNLLFNTNDRNIWKKRILDMRLPCTVVKLGAEGCMVLENEEFTFVPGFPVAKVVDTVGAGDGFAAGFLSSVIRGNSYVEAARIANAVGARCVTFYGDIEGLPTREELDAFMGTRGSEVER
ncbi:sugar kinase [Fodinisporobacter ferrooxydans]|uniref:Sugar kinase n=1 Tax=Fodinisporobacter ferrooxydans TaxID=2901836 RepID=A0ABY4CN43_9BACL|nr:sugar kinase [Alicyclobacillaceae bacterium MYW30-H2]